MAAVKKAKPARACDYDSWPAGVQAGYVLPKIDGVRGIHMNDRLQARTLEPFRNTWATARFDAYGDELAGLDGELIVGNNPTAEGLCRATASVLNRNPDPSTAGELHWYIFDDCTYPEEPYTERYNRARMRVLDLQRKGCTFIHIVPCTHVSNHTEVFEEHTRFRAAGFEGTVFRACLGSYKYGTSTAKSGLYLRIKDFKDVEATVVALIEAKENTNTAEETATGGTKRSTAQEGMVPKGVLGMIQVQDCPDFPDKLLDIGPGEMDHETRKLYWENPELLVGKRITFKYFPFGVKDKPRFPTFKCVREDE